MTGIKAEHYDGPNTTQLKRHPEKRKLCQEWGSLAFCAHRDAPERGYPDMPQNIQEQSPKYPLECGEPHTMETVSPL